MAGSPPLGPKLARLRPSSVGGGVIYREQQDRAVQPRRLDGTNNPSPEPNTYCELEIKGICTTRNRGSVMDSNNILASVV